MLALLVGRSRGCAYGHSHQCALPSKAAVSSVHILSLVVLVHQKVVGGQHHVRAAARPVTPAAAQLARPHLLARFGVAAVGDHLQGCGRGRQRTWAQGAVNGRWLSLVPPS